VAKGRPAPELRVVGNRLVDQDGATVQLRGVNRSGLEYACIQGWGFFDGPADDASVAAMASWGANVVRLPLNEDCWLGLNTPNPEYSGPRYREAVSGFVSRLHAYGLAVILDLQWTENGGQPASGTLGPLPDAEHARAFWTSVATTFAADRSVLFDLFNEPHDVSWTCWRDGCTVPGGWAGAGMQSLVDAVRAAGATQPILVGGLAYANDLSGWTAHAPVDPLHQLVASFHLYNFNACRTAACWDAQVAPVAERVPVVAGEVGEDDGTPALLRAFLPWADDHGIGYLGWAWNVWKDPIALISDYDGTPTAFGAGLRDHLLALAPASAPAAGADVDTGPMPLLSRGLPVRASSENYPARNAGSDDYSAMWRSQGYPCWVAYDVSSVPAPARTRLYSQWSNTNTYNYDTGVFADRTYNLPGDYVIEGNPAAGGGPVPASGWTTLVSVTGNAYHSAAHVFDATGSNWLRFRATAGNRANASENTDCALKWDLYDARAGVADSWMFYGDSVTAEALRPVPGHRDRNGHEVGTFAALVNASRPSHFPAQQNGGVGGLTLKYVVAEGLLRKWLADYPGKYVALAFGTNDVNSDVFDAEAYYRDLEAAVTLVENAGKTAIVPTLVASSAKRIQANGPAANEMVRRLYAHHTSVLPGPDLWALFTAHPNWIGKDEIHPTDTGSGELRLAWVTAVLTSVYG